MVPNRTSRLICFPIARSIPRLAAAIDLAHLQVEKAGFMDDLAPAPTTTHFGPFAGVARQYPVHGGLDGCPAARCQLTCGVHQGLGDRRDVPRHLRLQAGVAHARAAHLFHRRCGRVS